MRILLDFFLIYLVINLIQADERESSNGRVQKFMLGKLVDFSIKWVGGVSLVHSGK